MERSCAVARGIDINTERRAKSLPSVEVLYSTKAIEAEAELEFPYNQNQALYCCSYLYLYSIPVTQIQDRPPFTNQTYL